MFSTVLKCFFFFFFFQAEDGIRDYKVTGVQTCALPICAAPLDFAKLSALTFEEADAVRFPGLHLSWQALLASEGTTAGFNSSNQDALAAFLGRPPAFYRIHPVNFRPLQNLLPPSPGRPDDPPA